MKVKVYWKSKNPFNPDIDRLKYSKTLDIPDDIETELIIQAAEQDSRPGYVFDKLEILESS